MKFGLFNLIKTKDPGDWIWIIDSSIQMGLKKCVFILGVQAEKLKKENFILSHVDVEPIILKTVTSSRGEIIQAALMEAEAKTGIPIEIISDEGADMKRGIRLYREQQLAKNPIHIHDIVHKMDIILKKELREGSIWPEFMKKMNETMQKLKLSNSSHLVPPRQRRKERMRSEIDIIDWGQNIIRYLESGKATDFEKENLSWVASYKNTLNQFQEMANIFDFTIKEIRENGYSSQTCEKLENLCSKEISKESQNFFLKVISSVEQETKKIPQNMRLLGSSEIIESVFGKFKQLGKNHSSEGLSSLVLSLPALVGKITKELVRDAMETISIGEITTWAKMNLGITFCSKRREDFGKDLDYLELDDFTEALAI